MDHVQGIGGLTSAHGRLFVVVGVFDGLHVGHSYLLRHLIDESRSRAARPTVITFDAHPDAVLRGSAPPLLLDPGERARLLEEAGVDVLVVVHFDDALRRTPYDAFVTSIAARADLAGFLMTPDAAFGHERRGTPEALAELGRTMDPPFDVVVVPPFELDGEQVRSSTIRDRIAAGDLAGAERLLGRPYAVVGEGREVGVSRVAMTFPMPVALPEAGEYDVTIEWADGTRPWPAGAIVGPDGRMTLATIPFDGPARVEFA
jgi:riboflavin kinase / FMN adenylyltransferase